MKMIRFLLLSLALEFAIPCGALDPGDGTTRRIMPNDTIVIRVINETEFTVERKVSGEGRITYPYLGELDLRGKSTVALEKMIRDGLDKDYIINPQVVVDIKDYVKQFVTVTGQVNHPGRIELLPDRRLDLIAVLALAGDITSKAKKSKIELTRKGQAKPHRYSYDDLQKESDPEKKVYVEPDDLIVVAESNI